VEDKLSKRQRKKKEEEEEEEEKKKKREERRRRTKRGGVASPSYRVVGGPTSLEVGGQGGTDGPKRGFL